MAEAQVVTPKTGPGSKTGKRWFVSKFAELVITMVAEDFYLHKGQEVKQKARRLQFKKAILPRRLRGQGYNGTTNGARGDLNSSVYWGVYATNDQEVIDFLRQHEYFRTTPQDNKVHAEMRLKELDWNPDTLERGDGVSVNARALSPEDESDAPPTAPMQTVKKTAGASVGLAKPGA